MTIALGSRAMDKVTGLTGIVNAEYRHMYGVNQYSIQPGVVDGKIPDSYYIDEPVIQVLDEGISNDVPKAQQLQFTFGEEVQDTISLQRGIISNILIHLNGCVSFGVTTSSVDNKNPEIFFVNQNRLKFISAGISEPQVKVQRTGGPMIKSSSINVR